MHSLPTKVRVVFRDKTKSPAKNSTAYKPRSQAVSELRSGPARSPFKFCLAGKPLEETETFGTLRLRQRLRQSSAQETKTEDPLRVKLQRPAPLACAGCGEESPEGPDRFHKCTGCHVVRYCSAECQKRHWREHKKVCRPTDKTLEESRS